MQKNKLTFNSFFLAALYLFAMLLAPPSVVRAAEQSPLLLFFSGNVRGETEACG